MTPIRSWSNSAVPRFEAFSCPRSTFSDRPSSTRVSVSLIADPLSCGHAGIAVLSGGHLRRERGADVPRRQDRLWSKYDPYEIASTDGWQRNPERVWAWYLWRHHLVNEVEPNAGHRALADQRFAEVIASLQNVDDS